MAKKRSAKKKAVKKPVTKKTLGKRHVHPLTAERACVSERPPKASKQVKRNAKASVSRTSSKSSPVLKGLASLKALGAKSIDVHFHGTGDDGWYEYHVIGRDTKRPLELSAAAEEEVNDFLQANFEHYGDGPGSVLLARFDLVHAVCHGFSGDGDPGARLAELIAMLESHGAKKLVGHLRSGNFSQCKVVPASALAREKASDAVRSFLELTRDFAAEYGEYDEEEGYEPVEYALLDAAGGTLAIDVAARRVTLTQAPRSKSIEIAVDRLTKASLPLRFA